jgi:hypothetical protein
MKGTSLLIQLPSQVQADVQDAINQIYSAMLKADPGSEEYAKMVNAVTALEKVKDAKRAHNREIVSIVANIVASLAGIGLIIRHEQFNVITTKALGLLRKPKP